MYDNYSHYTRLIKTTLGFHNSAPHHYWGCRHRHHRHRPCPRNHTHNRNRDCKPQQQLQPPARRAATPRTRGCHPTHGRLYFFKTWGLRRQCQLGHVMQRSVHFDLGRHAPRACMFIKAAACAKCGRPHV